MYKYMNVYQRINSRYLDAYLNRCRYHADCQVPGPGMYEHNVAPRADVKATWRPVGSLKKSETCGTRWCPPSHKLVLESH